MTIGAGLFLIAVGAILYTRRYLGDGPPYRDHYPR